MKLSKTDRVLNDNDLSKIIGGAFWQGIGRWLDQHFGW
ncbi:bacteriocin [Lacticaseibacillus paracasei]|nr:bacteriocin [Lacticaseibacillus paracasei]EKQ15277.1 hypothetical protein LCAA2362_0414 [Lacticaseibacillus casei A2-362]PTS48898.1 bacteriocin [Lactobacillus sp. DS9_6]PTS60632.1 bacteriocin [Lactobacillus sp. DS15_6]PTS69629.1 bacteriocin [Lactobacillus sp. DS3_6]PTV39092.1 bacteriocin [Lactobacillus sp. DS18_6]WQG47637.1 bacteriocin [Lacticaseibacillus casei]